MKLYITNKQDFQQAIGDTREVHKRAFNVLFKDVSDGYIPLSILVDYNEQEEALFNFSSVKDDVYFYLFESLI